MMDKVEARKLLDEVLARYRARGYAGLVALTRDLETCEVTGASGRVYQLEIQALWDDRSQRNLRVLASIDDGGLSAFAPLTADFVIMPDGHLLGE